MYNDSEDYCFTLPATSTCIPLLGLNDGRTVVNMGIATAAFISAFYLLFIRIVNINRDLQDIGFDFLNDGTHRSAKNRLRSKYERVKETLKRRAIGNLPPVYPNGWFVLLESSDLRKEEVKYVSALGEHFAVLRMATGEVSILDAYCPHLGANMAIGGIVRGDCLECPFHKWTFSGKNGSCTSVSYSSAIPSAKVKKWLSKEVNDFIFVWYHAEDEDPAWDVEQNSNLGNGEMVFHGRSDIIVGCHIQEIPENGADIGHLEALHGASLLGGTDIRYCGKKQYQFLRHSWGASWEQSESESHKGILLLSHETTLLGKYVLSRIDASIQQIGPGYVELLLQTAFGPMLLLQTVTPLDQMEQRVIHRIYSPFWIGPLTRLTLYLETIMFQRDVMVWNHKRYEGKPHLVKEDRTILRHRRWYNQFYSEHSPRFSYQKDSLDW